MIQLTNDDNDPGVHASGIEGIDFKDWSIPAVRLLQGVVYSDEEEVWNLLLRSIQQLSGYFIRIGLVLVVNESEGMAFLRQLNEEEARQGFEKIPKLYRKTRLGYEATLLCVLMRDCLRRYEEEDMDNQRCVVQFDELFQSWKNFFAPSSDELRLRKSLEKTLRKLEELKLTRRFGEGDNAWEVRKILKARLPVEELERLRASMAQAAASKTPVTQEGE